MALGLPTLKSRRAKGSLIVNGQDILAGIAKDNILSFCYVDNTSDRADDLSIEIADPKRTWMQLFLPKKGIEVEAYITVQDWVSPFDNRPFRCGTFYIDEIHLRGGGGGNVVSIKGTSVPVGGLKTEKKTRAWENTDLTSISDQIAKENGLSLVYDAKENPEVKRTDQTEKADIEYIRERAKEAGLSVKIHDKKLVIYSEKEYEEKEAGFTLTYGSTNIIEFEFSTKCDDLYGSCENAYVNPETGRLTKTEFNPDEKPEGVDSKLKINEKIEFRKDGFAEHAVNPRTREGTLTGQWTDWKDYEIDNPAQNAGKGEGGRDESMRKCESKLREKNKHEKNGQIRVVGNISYLSGMSLNLKGFGIFDDKWFIETSSHEVNEGGYETNLTLRNTLKGY